MEVNGIYIHTPFCKSKCAYCDFHVFVNMEKSYSKYVDYVVKEIKLYPEYKYNTIYFGGGTPSVLGVDLIKKILNVLPKEKECEITLELNPTDMTYEKLKELRKAGINRLSIGIQSFNDNILKTMNRAHNKNEAIKVYEYARSAGFEDISIDIIFGVPNQTMQDLKNDLKMIKKISPDHISIYSLIWEEGTLFYKNLIEGKISKMDEDLEADMFLEIMDELSKQGYEHYEISSFAKNKKYGKHNFKYWENEEFIGVGVNATSFYENKRYSKVKSLSKYYKLIDQNAIPIEEKSIEEVDEFENERLKYILGLRKVSKGIKINYSDLSIETKEKIDKLIERKLLILEDGNLKLSKIGVLLSNEVFMEFI